MIAVPPPHFNYRTDNQANPSFTGLGTTLTPGNNTYPAYASILAPASITEDCFGVLLGLDALPVAATNRDMLIKIGIDRAGGTSYVDWIPHLICGESGTVGTQKWGQRWYYFPLFVPSGAQIAASASVNNATVGTARAYIRLFGRPSHPDFWYGHKVYTFGEATATSKGTVIVPGNAAEGTYVQLGSATPEDIRYWQVGLGGSADTTLTNHGVWLDLAYGNATNKSLIIEDEHIITTGSEEIHYCGYINGPNYYKDVPSGSLIYARGMSEASNTDGVSALAYGVA